MKTLQIGMAKSGNYLLYKIIQSLIKSYGLSNSRFVTKQPIYEVAKEWHLHTNDRASRDSIAFQNGRVFYTVGAPFRMPIDDINEYVRHVSHVWCECSFEPVAESVLPLFDKIAYIVRDPRDVAVSWGHYAFTPYMLYHSPRIEESWRELLSNNFERLMNIWVRHVSGYSAAAVRDRHDIHFVRFEELAGASKPATIENLIRYFGLEIKREAVEAALVASARKTMQTENPDHVRKGAPGEWRDVLTREQVDAADRVAGKWLEKLGYPRG